MQSVAVFRWWSSEQNSNREEERQRVIRQTALASNEEDRLCIRVNFPPTHTPMGRPSRETATVLLLREGSSRAYSEWPTEQPQTRESWHQQAERFFK